MAEFVDIKDGRKIRPLTILAVMDSVRFDQFVASETPNMRTGGFKLVEALSGASWTVPSVVNMMTGRLPYYNNSEQAFGNYYWLPSDLHDYGYTTHYVSAMGLPVHIIKHGWDTFYAHGQGKVDAETLIDKAQGIIKRFPGARKFIYLHFEETHSPFECADNGGPESTDWRVKDILSFVREEPHNLPPDYFEYLKLRQRQCINFMDRVLKPLMDLDCSMMITSDHGELFGEDNKIGHDIPPAHPNLHLVPLLVRV